MVEADCQAGFVCYASMIGNEMKILIACEFSGIVSNAFRSKGYESWSCDLIPSEGNTFYHYIGNVLKILYDDWDMLIAHPPCTYLSNSGVKHLYKDGRKENGRDEKRWAEMQEAVSFFRLLWNCPIKKIAIENPIMHGHAKSLIGPQTQIIQPWQFGTMQSKATCLWLKNLPQLKPTNNVYDKMMKLPYSERNKVHYASPGPERWKERSRTDINIANAMAEQWG